MPLMSPVLAGEFFTTVQNKEVCAILCVQSLRCLKTDIMYSLDLTCSRQAIPFSSVNLYSHTAPRPCYVHHHYHCQRHFSECSFDLCQLRARGSALSPDNFTSCLTLGRVVKNVGFIVSFFPPSEIMCLAFDTFTKFLLILSLGSLCLYLKPSLPWRYLLLLLISPSRKLGDLIKLLKKNLVS